MTRNGGRPRVFDNEAVFSAIASLLAQHGVHGLTLEIVAREVGVSAPAISRRFSSKSGLIEQYLRWTEARVQARFLAVREACSSPLTALLARYLLPIPDRLEEVSPYTGMFEMLQDAALGPVLQASWEPWYRESSALLREAQQIGELLPFNTARIARVLSSALGGAIVNFRPDDPALLQFYEEIFETILGPLVPPGKSLPDPAVARSVHISID